MHIATEHTYDLNDLDSWPACLDRDQWASGWPHDGVALAVIGSPIAHSLSPVMHNAALAKLASYNSEFKKWRYFKFKIDPTELEVALRSFHEKKFRGLNLTVPHKALVVPWLKESTDAFVRDAGAANTLRFTNNNYWEGYNTDGIGLSAALEENLDVSLKDAHVILLGAGGAGRAAAVQCLKDHCASLWVGNRTKVIREEVVASLRKTEHQFISSFSLRDGPFDNLPDNAIVINATSVGLKPDDVSPIDLKEIPRPSFVYDMIYRPPQTALLRQAAALGIPHANGLSMLVHQGARSLELWTGEIAPVKIMQDAVRGALANS